MYQNNFSPKLPLQNEEGKLLQQLHHVKKYWHERAAFRRSAFGRSTAGNDVVATISIRCFFFSRFFFSVATFSHRRSARIKKLIQRKLTGTPKNLGVDTFPDPLCHFGAPWRPFWILQAVRRCRRLASAPFGARLVFFYLFTPIFILSSEIARSGVLQNSEF